jgi:putative transcriptional regulator
MSIRHHIDNATLLRYASGDLDEAFLVVVASHLAMCGACRQAVHLAEAIGGHALEESEAAPVTSGAFDRLMHRIESNSSVPPVKKIADKSPYGDVPLPLHRYIGSSLANVHWKMVAPGVRKHDIVLSGNNGTSLYMLKIGSGRAVPEHGHGGSEMTLILSGAYQDIFGRFGSGDIADLDEHVEHQPIVEPGEPCICLVATEAPTRFKGFFSRLLQPLVGI